MKQTLTMLVGESVLPHVLPTLQCNAGLPSKSMMNLLGAGKSSLFVVIFT